MNDLSSFIEAQRSAGSFESAGSFTLALEKAVTKLSSHSLVNPEDYILKLVQCAVRLKVDELHVKLLSRSVLVFFETDAADRTVSVESLSQALVAPLEETNQARSYLAMAICGISGQNPQELMWGDWDDKGQGTILSLAEGRSEVYKNAPFPRTEPLAKGRRFFLFFLTKPSNGLPMSQTSAEHAALTRRCSFAPMPIILDGSAIGPSLPQALHKPTVDPVSELSSPYLGALELKTDRNNPLRWPPIPPKRAWRTIPDGLNDFSPTLPPIFRLRLPPELYRSPPPSGTKGTHSAPLYFKEAFGVPVYLFGPSSLHYVKDGVCLNPIRGHDGGGGAFAILPGDAVTTDLSGLSVVVDDTVESDLERCVEVWKSQVALILSTDVPVYDKRSVFTRGSTVASALGCCLLPPFGLLAGPIYAWISERRGGKAQAYRKFNRQLRLRGQHLGFNRKRGESDESREP